MLTLSDLIAPEAIAPRLAAPNKRAALQTLAEQTAASVGADPRAAFEAVLMRERLAGTGVGEGVAIPHARVPGLARPACGFARLDPAQDFGALDGLPADLAFLLLSPQSHGGDHLKALARIARFLKRADVRDRLRAARGAEELRAVFAGDLESDAA